MEEFPLKKTIQYKHPVTTRYDDELKADIEYWKTEGYDTMGIIREAARRAFNELNRRRGRRQSTPKRSAS